jgi:hypothetical protein
MANFETLPNELLARAISLLDKYSLSQVRLVNKRLEQISVERLFERITLYAHWKKESFCASGDRQWTVRPIERRDQEDEAVGFEVASNSQSPFDCATPRLSTSDRYADTINTNWDDECWREELRRRLDRELGIATQRQLCERVNDQASSAYYNSVVTGTKQQFLDSSTTVCDQAVDYFADDSNRDEDGSSRFMSQGRSSTRKHRGSSFRHSKSSSPVSQQRQDLESSSIRCRLNFSTKELKLERTREAGDMPSDTESRTYAEEDSQRFESEQPELEDEEDVGWISRSNLRIRAASSPTPQWATDGFPGPPNYDARLFRNILQNATLNKYVREVQIYTCKTDCVGMSNRISNNFNYLHNV